MAMKMNLQSSVNVNPKSELKTKTSVNKDVELPSKMGLPDGPVYHEQLKGRERPNQHPISSVIGLQEELDALREFAESRGESAYEIAVRNGFEGTEVEWLESLKGVQGASGYDVPRLQIESTRGNMFKHSAVSTVLRVVIFYGSYAIRSYSDLLTCFGPTARLQWYWQEMGSDVYHIVSSDDPRLSNEGFIFGISPADVDTKITFRCELIVN